MQEVVFGASKKKGVLFSVLSPESYIESNYFRYICAHTHTNTHIHVWHAAECLG